MRINCIIVGFASWMDVVVIKKLAKYTVGNIGIERAANKKKETSGRCQLLKRYPSQLTQ
jgi:hypothetical protein